MCRAVQQDVWKPACAGDGALVAGVDGQPEVCQLELPIPAQQYVLGLYVTVDDAQRVAVRQRLRTRMCTPVDDQATLTRVTCTDAERAVFSGPCSDSIRTWEETKLLGQC